METAHSTRKLTYADYERLPDDNLRHEIIGGRHVVSPSPVTRHQRLLGELYYLLRVHLAGRDSGEVFISPFDLVLSEFDIVVPDLIYLSRERAHFLTEKNLQGPPDLVVEILSPGTRRRDLGVKRNLYERVGVREYWLVDPGANTVTVFRRSDVRFEAPVVLSRAAADVLASPLFGELQIPLEKLLA